MLYSLLLLCLTHLSFAQSANTEISLPLGVESQMLLQREGQVSWKILSKNANGLSLQIFNKEGLSVMQKDFPAQEDGNVYVTFSTKGLPPAEGYTILLQAAENKIELKNIAIGELLLCSGQSNMAWALQNVRAVQTDPDLPAYEKFFSIEMEKSLRILTIPALMSLYPISGQDAKQLPAYAASHWRSIEEMRSERKLLDSSSLTCAYTAHQLFHFLKQSIPVGYISVAYGGTAIESWGRSYPNNHTPAYLERPSYRKWQETRDKLSRGEQIFGFFDWKCRKTAMSAGENLFGLATYLCLQKYKILPYGATFNAMISPLENIQPGHVIWNQGESNASKEAHTPYKEDLSRLMSDWYPQADLPNLHITQISHGYPAFGQVRSWQMEVVRENTSMKSITTVIDLNPEQELHYYRRKEIGIRTASSITSLWQNPEYEDPVKTMRWQQNGLVVLVSAPGWKNSLSMQSENSLCTDFELETLLKNRTTFFKGKDLQVRVLKDAIEITLPAEAAQSTVQKITYGIADKVHCFFHYTDPHDVQQAVPTFQLKTAPKSI